MRWMFLVLVVGLSCSEDGGGAVDGGRNSAWCTPSGCAERCQLRGDYLTGACVSGWFLGPCDCCACASDFEGLLFLDDVFGECDVCGVAP